MITFKIALRLAFSRDVRQRWRQVTLVLAGLVATLLTLAGAGVLHAALESDNHIRARSPVWSPSPETAHLNISLRGLLIDGQQFPVVWLQPRAGHENDSDVLPPGLSRLPAPGEGVISPGLAERGFSAEDFGLKTSSAGTGPGGTIGVAGLSTSSEGWIYARPPAGRSLGEGGALLGLDGYSSAGPRATLETTPQVPSAKAALLGLLWLVLGPCLFLLLGAGRALSHVRDERAATLLRFGVASAQIRILLAVETVLLSLPGAVLALVAWVAGLSRIRSLPLTGATLNPGALQLPLWLALLVTGATACLASMAAIWGRIDLGARRTQSRPVHRWHVLPLGLSVAMMVASRYASPFSAASQYLLFGGLILTLGALPLALPVAVQAVGGLLSRSPRAPVWLAGRRLSLRAVALSRPAAVVGVLVFLAGGAFAVHGRMLESEPEVTAHVPLTRFVVNWRDARAGDLDLVRQRISGLVTVPVIENGDGTSSAVFDSCAQAEEATASLGRPACGPDGRITTAFAESFHAITMLQPALGTRIAPDNPEVLLVGADDVAPVEVMRELAGVLPAVNITQLGAPDQPPSTVGWLIAGWILASLVLSFALLREVGDRTLASLGEDLRLTRLGLDPQEISATQRWTVLPPVIVAIPVGYVGAIAFALFGYYLGFTVNYIARITAVAALVAALATLSLGLSFFVHRRLTPGAERARPFS